MRWLPLRYARWMIRDLALAQFALVVAIAVLTGIVLTQVSPSPTATDGPMIITQMLNSLGWIIVLTCVGGIVATDRTQGFYRTAFSRPVSPVGYYLQRWVLGGVVVALVVPVLGLGIMAAVGRFAMPWDLAGSLLLLYLLLGGLCFLFSTLTRLDWLFAISVMIMQNILHQLRSRGLSPFWRTLESLLPPFHLADYRSPLPTGTGLLHILLYGAGVLALALAILRWRPLGVGGRS